VRQLIARNSRVRRRCRGGIGQAGGIAYIDRILAEGSGADRQLRVFHATNDLKQVGLLITETGTRPLRGSGAVERAGTTPGAAVDEELTPGARNAVVHCLRIRPEEKVTLITDWACREIAAALARELESQGLLFHAWILEDLAPRPLTDMPREVLDDMESSQVSIFAVRAQTNELRTRMQMTDVVNRRQMRHAHMVNIRPRIMLEGSAPISTR